MVTTLTSWPLCMFLDVFERQLLHGVQSESVPDHSLCINSLRGCNQNLPKRELCAIIHLFVSMNFWNASHAFVLKNLYIVIRKILYTIFRMTCGRPSLGRKRASICQCKGTSSRISFWPISEVLNELQNGRNWLVTVYLYLSDLTCPHWYLRSWVEQKQHGFNLRTIRLKLVFLQLWKATWKGAAQRSLVCRDMWRSLCLRCFIHRVKWDSIPAQTILDQVFPQQLRWCFAQWRAEVSRTFCETETRWPLVSLGFLSIGQVIGGKAMHPERMVS